MVTLEEINVATRAIGLTGLGKSKIISLGRELESILNQLSEIEENQLVALTSGLGVIDGYSLQEISSLRDNLQTALNWINTNYNE